MNFNHVVFKRQAGACPFTTLSKLLAFTIACFLICSFDARAQSSGEITTAIIDQNMMITLLPTAPLKTAYTADISHLSFNNQEEATTFFNNYRDNYVSFEVDLSSNKLTITLYKQYAPTAWTSAEWNEHFKQKAALYSANK